MASTSDESSTDHVEPSPTVAVVGLGYIGLPTALLLAREQSVVGVDIDEEKVADIRAGRLPFEEPGLDRLFEDVRDRFTVQTDVPDTVDTYLVAVPTPLDELTDVANLTYVRAATETVAEALDPGDLVVLESTVPPGTSKQLVQPILESKGPDEDVRYAYCPERASPGDTLQEMVHNDRVVGCADDATEDRIEDLYGFVEGDLFLTVPTEAELVKLIENTFRDVNIALANEFALLAEEYGVNVHEATRLANEHPRVNVHRPGPGVGGHCLPIDPQFLTQSSTASQLVSVARDINDSMPVHTLHLVRSLLSDTVVFEDDTLPQVALLGVAYKGNIDDTRQTPALKLVRLAKNEGYDVRVADPHVESFEVPLSPMADAADGSDCLVVVTDHDEYTELDPEEIGASMRHRNVVDTRGLLDADRWEDAGFTVRRLGDGRRE